jgi:hypothetical protein
MVRSEKDWSIGFAKCVTSVSGAEIAEGPQPSDNITLFKEPGERSPDGSVSSVCAAQPAIMRKPTMRGDWRT